MLTNSGSSMTMCLGYMMFSVSHDNSQQSSNLLMLLFVCLIDKATG